MDNTKDNFKNEIVRILGEAIEELDPEIEEGASIITIIADVDSNKFIFGGLHLRDSLEEEGEYDIEQDNVYKVAKTEYLADCFQELLGTDAIPQEDGEYLLEESVENLYSIISEAINENEDLKSKIDGIYMLFGWAKFGIIVEAESNPFY